MDNDKEDVSGNVAKLGKVIGEGGERVKFEVWEGQSLARFGFLIDQKKKGGRGGGGGLIRLETN